MLIVGWKNREFKGRCCPIVKSFGFFKCELNFVRNVGFWGLCMLWNYPLSFYSETTPLSLVIVVICIGIRLVVEPHLCIRLLDFGCRNFNCFTLVILGFLGD